MNDEPELKKSESKPRPSLDKRLAALKIAPPKEKAGMLVAKPPIGSDEIESGHRHVIQQHFKLAGSWWRENQCRGHARPARRTLHQSLGFLLKQTRLNLKLTATSDHTHVPVPR